MVFTLWTFEDWSRAWKWSPIVLVVTVMSFFFFFFFFILLFVRDRWSTEVVRANFGVDVLGPEMIVRLRMGVLVRSIGNAFHIASMCLVISMRQRRMNERILSARFPLPFPLPLLAFGIDSHWTKGNHCCQPILRRGIWSSSYLSYLMLEMTFSSVKIIIVNFTYSHLHSTVPLCSLLSNVHQSQFSIIAFLISWSSLSSTSPPLSIRIHSTTNHWRDNYLNGWTLTTLANIRVIQSWHPWTAEHLVTDCTLSSLKCQRKCLNEVPRRTDGEGVATEGFLGSNA